MTGKNRIMIYGSKDDGAYVIEFRTAESEVLAISIPRTEAAWSDSDSFQHATGWSSVKVKKSIVNCAGAGNVHSADGWDNVVSVRYPVNAE
jgi:hypothetical protein